MMYKSVMQHVADQIKEGANKHPLETVNVYMRDALVDCSTKAKTKSEFLSLVKRETGLTETGMKRNEAVNYLLKKFNK